MRDLMDHTLRGIYPNIDVRGEPTITLVDGADRVVPGMDPRLSAIAQRRLEQLRVRVMLRTLVSEVGERSLRTKDGTTLTANTVIWAGGVKTNPLVAAIDLPHAKDGRLVVDTSFRVGGRDDVLVLGDAAHFEQGGKPLPMLAQVAVLEAPVAASRRSRTSISGKAISSRSVVPARPPSSRARSMSCSRACPHGPCGGRTT
jgi:NADH dehydrogenase